MTSEVSTGRATTYVVTDDVTHSVTHGLTRPSVTAMLSTGSENNVKSYYVEMHSGMEAIVQATGPKAAKNLAEEKFGEQCSKCREIKVSKKPRVWEIVQEPLGADCQENDTALPQMTWDQVIDFVAGQLAEIVGRLRSQ